ncbi:MAG: acylphosphatase [Chthoniobacterales bacterium]
MAKICKRVFYEGRVQGVGFRYSVRQLACGYDISGTVQNLADGRVALVIEGQERETEDFLQGIRESALAGHIKTENSEICPLQGLLSFQIIA